MSEDIEEFNSLKLHNLVMISRGLWNYDPETKTVSAIFENGERADAVRILLGWTGEITRKSDGWSVSRKFESDAEAQEVISKLKSAFEAVGKKIEVKELPEEAALKKAKDEFQKLEESAEKWSQEIENARAEEKKAKLSTMEKNKEKEIIEKIKSLRKNTPLSEKPSLLEASKKWAEIFRNSQAEEETPPTPRL